MAITPVSKAQAMRPAEIAAIDALNEAITELNQLDITGLNTRLSNIESSISTINTDLNAANTGLKARMTAAEGDIDTCETNIAGIKTTLYTNLDVTS